MMTTRWFRVHQRQVSAMALGAVFVGIIAAAAVGQNTDIGEVPAIKDHLEQEEILADQVPFAEIVEVGRRIFVASLNRLDGAGRPETNGAGSASRARRDGVEAFNRISGPDANSCLGCHNRPRAGGGGDNASNAFVLAGRFGFINAFDEPDPVTGETPGSLKTAGVERNTPGLFGAGAIEMLAREMTADLHGIRAQALAQANQNGAPVTLPLDTKGVNFGRITGNPDGTVGTSQVEGVDPDLIIKPFGAKGTMVSLRQAVNDETNFHLGMQSVERFGQGTDPDGDGVTNELGIGDVTAVTLHLASLAFPGNVRPGGPIRSILRGEEAFTEIGCASCHKPVMELNSRFYSEPNPHNPPGNLRPGDFPGEYRFDLTAVGDLPRPRLSADAKVLIQAFTDLKRHDLGPDPRINNETLEQNRVPTSVFLTRKLWGAGSEPPYLHNGRATLIRDAIDAHGGEAQASRAAFLALSMRDQSSLVEFVKSLVVHPPGTKDLLVINPQ